METEFALGFQPSNPSVRRPAQKDLFQALLRVLKAKRASLAAAYYKGGEFLENGSLIHFEVSRLDDPSVGLLEWATPECLGSVEAAVYAKAQERALASAVREAQADLGDQGYTGRLFLLKNNEDRYGNAYGCHESYDVGERPLDWIGRLFRLVLHPLMLAGLVLLGLVFAAPLLVFFCVAGLVFVVVQVIGAVPGLRLVAEKIQALLGSGMEFLVEASPTPGSGLVAHASLLFLRIGGALFSLTGSKVVFRGHLPALLPFLVTRPVIAGAGSLGADGRYVLTPRAKLMTRAVGAFIYGRARPLVDIKEFFYRTPFGYSNARKRLHLLAGDANRSEYTELLKLAVTEAVLDAIEAGALDELAASIELAGSPVAAFRRVAQDPTLQAAVARDRRTGAALTALAVQRSILEAVWAHFRSLPDVRPETKDALVRWNFVLDRLSDDPRTLDRELDWVIKLKLLGAALTEAMPAEAEPWAALAAWGPINEAVERRAPHLELGEASTREAVVRAVRSALGLVGFARARRHCEARGLEWGAFAVVRRAYLRLKTIDLKYHEISADGGYYDWLRDKGEVARVLDEASVLRADTQPPQRTRATIRGKAVQRHAGADSPETVRVGWDRLVFEQPHGEPRIVRLDDPYAFEGEDLG